MAKRRGAYRVLVGKDAKFEDRRRQEDNIKMTLQELG
jgi:hypothetical protein